MSTLSIWLLTLAVAGLVLVAYKLLTTDDFTPDRWHWLMCGVLWLEALGLTYLIV